MIMIHTANQFDNSYQVRLGRVRVWFIFRPQRLALPIKLGPKPLRLTSAGKAAAGEGQMSYCPSLSMNLSTAA
jgi:hypothetical protein